MLSFIYTTILTISVFGLLGLCIGVALATYIDSKISAKNNGERSC